MSLLLQFCSDGQGKVWQDLLPIRPNDVEEAQQAAARLSRFGPLLWRIVRNDEGRQRLSSFNGLRWQIALLSPPVEEPLPWFSPRKDFGGEDYKQTFAPTVPQARTDDTPGDAQ